MMRSARTAPDLVHEDTFRINSDIRAGHSRPLDDHIAERGAWDQFVPTAREAARAEDRG
ncbi:hypothetical protein [Streptomyces sp. NPDC096153]|uniref:hypothetical protein n=1 Tax=Streptomyces sp. NPDC096153 TaxID=3155548 RepID=UPI003329A931